MTEAPARGTPVCAPLLRSDPSADRGQIFVCRLRHVDKITQHGCYHTSVICHLSSVF